jgi:hypothetical protein
LISQLDRLLAKSSSDILAELEELTIDIEARLLLTISLS